MSYKKYLKDNAYENKLTVSKSRLFFVSLEGLDTISEVCMFFIILLSCYSMIPPRCKGQRRKK